MTDNVKMSSPTCPFCNYEMTVDDMIDHPDDLFALAPNEGTTTVKCPSCDLEYWVQGSYKPQYTSVCSEDELT